MCSKPAICNIRIGGNKYFGHCTTWFQGSCRLSIKGRNLILRFSCPLICTYIFGALKGGANKFRIVNIFGGGENLKLPIFAINCY